MCAGGPGRGVRRRTVWGRPTPPAHGPAVVGVTVTCSSFVGVVAVEAPAWRVRPARTLETPAAVLGSVSPPRVWKPGCNGGQSGGIDRGESGVPPWPEAVSGSRGVWLLKAASGLSDDDPSPPLLRLEACHPEGSVAGRMSWPLGAGCWPGPRSVTKYRKSLFPSRARAHGMRRGCRQQARGFGVTLGSRCVNRATTKAYNAESPGLRVGSGAQRQRVGTGDLLVQVGAGRTVSSRHTDAG